jgi:AcrR family transcriptional regulator
MKSQKREILKAAAVLFHHRGYKATTLHEVAKAVNMEAPSLYNHIKSKQELLSVLLLLVGKKFVEGIDVIVYTSLSPLKKLEKIVQLHIDLSYEYNDAMSLMFAEYIHLNEADMIKFLKLKSDYEVKFRGVIQDCIESGDIVDNNIDLMVFTLLSTLRSIYAWIAKYKEFNRVELEVQLTHYLLHGVLNNTH